jgi:hypothetical protein
MWWKRKETDVFPSFEVGSSDDRSNFHKIMDQFEVKPNYEILAKKKFLPMPRHLKLEMARIEEQNAHVLAAKALEEQEAGLEDEQFGNLAASGKGDAEGDEEKEDKEDKEQS